ncbi:C-reactive protein-like [Hemicordylus capensis]|uniref:C-reactive protein-like n=1 Tax=Hemicordylus capensis TaxID=884348 RepID=UPI00230323C9|nr:C-reactive protein-like [Hemicordylus capensis]
MGTLHTFLLILVGLIGSRAQEDLQGKAFVFAEASTTAYVVLNTAQQQPLTGFTVCLKFYTDLTREFGLFSWATSTTDNDILILRSKPTLYNLYVGGTAVSFTVPSRQSTRPGEEKLCVSWESATGLVELWLDGQPFPRKGVKKGYFIHPKASIVLGQDQDSYGGGFDASQSFVGELRDLYMWDRVLTADQISLVWDDSTLPDYLINWRSLPHDIRGYVVVKPFLAPLYSAQ